jgi:hypothetical protein
MVFYSPTDDPDFRFDIIRFLYLVDCGLTDEEMKSHWYSLSNDIPDTKYYCFDDKALLETFTHYHILQVPETEKLSKKDAFMYWMDGK